METVEVTVPVTVPVPDARTEPIQLRPYPDGPLSCSDLTDEILYLESIAERCNADRAWIREREGKVIQGEQ